MLLVLCAIGVATATTFPSGALNKTATSAAQLPPRDATVRIVPEGLQDAAWLLRLRDAQVKAVDGVAAFHDFQFTDRLTESGISFKHRIVDDAGKTYKAAHYDHGNGIAIARRRRGRPPRHLLRQPGRRQSTLEECRRRQVPGHHRLGWRRRCPARSASPRRLPTSTTTATRTCTSRRSAAATGCSRTTASGRFRDITAASGLDLRRALVERGVLRLQPRRPARPVPRQRRTVHDEHDRRRRLQVLRRRSKTRSPAT